MSMPIQPCKCLILLIRLIFLLADTTDLIPFSSSPAAALLASASPSVERNEINTFDYARIDDLGLMQEDKQLRSYKRIVIMNYYLINKVRLCSDKEYLCDNGRCIDITKFCDDKADCTDDSDENGFLCALMDCYDNNTVYLNYGDCVNAYIKCTEGDNLLCDGFKPPTTEQFTNQPRFTSRTCDRVPNRLHGKWILKKTPWNYNQALFIGTSLRFHFGTRLFLKCDPGYKRTGNMTVLCKLNGEWTGVPDCEEIHCPPLNSASRKAYCTYEHDRVSCDSSVLAGTVARINCRSRYIKNATDTTKHDNVTCNINGMWQPQPIKCVPVCGLLTPAGTWRPLIVNGIQASDFPWHGTLYKAKANEKQFTCGATIIKENLLVTAAHCVYSNGQKKIHPPSKFYVAVGNTYRDYDIEDTTVQKARVKEIFIPCSYLGYRGNYASDIAILQIDKPITFSDMIIPICLDTTSATKQTVMEVGSYGKVAGFGRTAKESSSYILLSLTVPYVSLNNCKSISIDEQNEEYVTPDKFCAGYTNGSSTCDGDSGGGFAFEVNNKWYLKGIVSMGIGSIRVDGERFCNNYAYTLYTRVSSHLDWMQDVIIHVETNKSFPICDKYYP